jgi:MFS family permease
MKKQQVWTAEFFGISLSNFFQFMAHYALIATLPIFIVDSLRGNDWQAGLAMTFFQIGAICCRPLAGKWIDEFNKKKLLFIALAFFLLVSILYIGVASLYFLLAIRLLHGAVFATGNALLATLAALLLPKERKGEGIGYYTVFSNLAMVLGPALGLWVCANYQFDMLFVGCTILAILSFGCGIRNNLANCICAPAKKSEQFGKWRSIIEPRALPAALLGGLTYFAYSGVLVFFPLYAKLLNFPEYTSLFFTLFAVAIVASRPVVGKLFDRCGANTVVYPGFFMFALGLVVLSGAQDLTNFLAAGVITGIGFGALTPAFQTLAIINSPPNRAGVATATYFLALDISVGIGSSLLSIIVLYSGYHAMYLVVALVVSITAVCYYILSQRNMIVQSRPPVTPQM